MDSNQPVSDFLLRQILDSINEMRADLKTTTASIAEHERKNGETIARIDRERVESDNRTNVRLNEVEAYVAGQKEKGDKVFRGFLALATFVTLMVGTAVFWVINLSGTVNEMNRYGTKYGQETTVSTDGKFNRLGERMTSLERRQDRTEGLRP